MDEHPSHTFTTVAASHTTSVEDTRTIIGYERYTQQLNALTGRETQ
jgi:hypothetical protein